MDVTLSTAPIVGYLLLFVSTITQGLKYQFRLPGDLELHNDDIWLMYGSLAQNRAVLFIATFPGGIAAFVLPLKVGLADGWLAGFAMFTIYNFSAFMIIKIITRIGIQPVFFCLSIFTSPIGMILVIFNIRLI